MINDKNNNLPMSMFSGRTLEQGVQVGDLVMWTNGSSLFDDEVYIISKITDTHFTTMTKDTTKGKCEGSWNISESNLVYLYWHRPAKRVIIVKMRNK